MARPGIEPSRRSRSRFVRVIRAARDVLVYAAVKTGLAIVSRLPPAAACGLARAGGDILFLLARRRRHIALRNLDIAFRDGRTRREKLRIARWSFRHGLAGLAGLALRGRWVREQDLERLFVISPEDDRLLREPHPRGLALLSAHAGDWEMSHHYLALRGTPVAVVAREVSNRLLDREIRRLRSRRGSRTIPKQGALAGLRAALRRGEAAGILADQNCPARERFFDFFGVAASTYTEHARILVRSGARILFIACLREGPREGIRFRFRIVLRDLGAGLPDFAGAPPQARARLRADELVRRYLEAAEDLARERPEQSLWIHRRWKSRPTGAPWLYHDLGEPLDPQLLEPLAVPAAAQGSDRNAVER